MLEASKISGLAIKENTTCERLDREAFRKLAKEIILKDISKKELPYEEMALKFLGIIPEDYDYQNCLLDAYATSAAAFYSPYLKKFILPNWTETPKAILVHEAQHALQDQHFNTSKFGNDTFLLSDKNLAAASLLEGDAMEVEGRYIDIKPKGENADPDKSAKLSLENPSCELPEILQEILSSPYDYGLLFVRNVKTALGEKYLNKIFSHPPQTSREILYYKEYLEPQKARQSILKNKALFSKSIGEISLRVFLRIKLGMKKGVLGASGLQSDTITIEKTAEGYKVIFKTIWDSEKDASEFRQAMTEVSSRRFGMHLSKDALGWTIETARYSKLTLLQTSSKIELMADVKYKD